MKVSDLEGAELCYWVARAEDREVVIENSRCWLKNGKLYDPVNDWSQCGPLIDKYSISPEPTFDLNGGRHWVGCYPVMAADDEGDVLHYDDIEQTGRTAREAICRAVVASVYGDEVPNETKPREPFATEGQGK